MCLVGLRKHIDQSIVSDFIHHTPPHMPHKPYIRDWIKYRFGNIPTCTPLTKEYHSTANLDKMLANLQERKNRT